MADAAVPTGAGRKAVGRGMRIPPIPIRASPELRVCAVPAAVLAGCLAILGAAVCDASATRAPSIPREAEPFEAMRRVRDLQAAFHSLLEDSAAIAAAREQVLPAPSSSAPGAAVPPLGTRSAADAGQEEAPRAPLFDTMALLHRVEDADRADGEVWRRFAEQARHAAAVPSISPSEGRLSSPFVRHRLHPVLHIRRPHLGLDIAAPSGTPILAPARGKVRFAGFRLGGYGNVVEIDHDASVMTRFAHASRILVRAGQMVERGQVVAKVGATGLATSPHVHYEVLVRGRQVDPLPFVHAPNVLQQAR
jgi:murein DD-endopeptidase MepM/ murein hydrolase activator NlpD